MTWSRLAPSTSAASTSSLGSDCRLAIKVSVTRGSVFQVMIVISAGHTEVAVARNGIGWDDQAEASEQPVDGADPRIQHPAPDQDRDDRRRRPRHQQAARGRPSAADTCATVLLVKRNASASPSTMRTVTPTTVSQMTVFHSTRRKSGLVTAPGNCRARPRRRRASTRTGSDR